MNFIKNISRLSMSSLGNIILLATSAAIALCGIGLTALYLIKYVDRNAPEIKTLECAIGITRADCPDNHAKLHALEAKLSDLQAKTDAAEGKLNNLRKIESVVNEVTLFATHDDPNSDSLVMVGTVYTRLVEPDKSPNFYCYIELPRGSANENRNLYIRNNLGHVELDANTLRKAGMSEQTLAFARSVCKPTLIGG